MAPPTTLRARENTHAVPTVPVIGHELGAGVVSRTAAGGSSRPRVRDRSWKESRQTAFFWAHVVVTAIMVMLFVVVLRADGSRILRSSSRSSLVWLVGFVSSSFRVTVSADTLGPPVDHRLERP